LRTAARAVPTTSDSRLFQTRLLDDAFKLTLLTVFVFNRLIMSKLVKIRSLAWLFGGWLGVVAILLPQGVIVCIGEPAHVELEILGGACCDGGAGLTAVPADVVTNLPTNTCADCSHVQAASWHYYSNHLYSKRFDQEMNVRSQAVCVSASAFDGFGKPAIGYRLAVADPIPPLLLEHLSTSVLIC
jgi:hypothetical protein